MTLAVEGVHSKVVDVVANVEVGVEGSLGDNMLTAGNRLKLSGHSSEFLCIKVSNQN